jgi:perosamine synthetase
VDAIVEQRSALCDAFDAEHIGYRRFWLPLHRQDPYRAADAQFPNATWLADRALWLPSAFQMTDDDVQRVCRLVREVMHAAV